MKIKLLNKGFSLPEMLAYVAILTILMIAIANLSISLTKSMIDIKIAKDIAISAQLAFERMGNEIRKSYNVDAQSVLNTNPGILVLNSYDSEGSPENIRFYKNGNSLVVDNGEQGGSSVAPASGPIISDSVVLDNLVFRKITASTSIAVKIEMTLSAGTGYHSRSENFYDTIVLRGKYGR